MIQVLTNCYARNTKISRQSLDNDPAVLLCERQDMLTALLNEHLRAVFRLGGVGLRCRGFFAFHPFRFSRFTCETLLCGIHSHNLKQ
jgi:hypothetical protein